VCFSVAGGSDIGAGEPGELLLMRRLQQVRESVLLVNKPVKNKKERDKLRDFGGRMLRWLTDRLNE
jgi:hypothetical protein